MMRKYYERKDLAPLTVYRLREIAREETLVKSMLYDLDREELIELILSYRNADAPVEIDGLTEEMWGKLSDVLKSVKISEAVGLEAPSKIALYEGMDLLPSDGYELTGRAPLRPGLAFVVSAGTELCAVLALKRDRAGRLYITRNGRLPAKESDFRGYELICMDGDSSAETRALLSGRGSGMQLRAISLPLLDFSVFSPISTDTPLAIDFGTSNTTMGIYLDFELARKMKTGGGLRNELAENSVNPVLFMRENGETSPLLPSAIAVLDVSKEDKEDVEYAFGEKALSLASSVYAQEGMSVFLDIKRWVSAADGDEEAIDKNGRRRLLPRKNILRAFLLYAIRTAEQYYKCNFKFIHISAPVKERHRFHALFKALLPEYTLLPALDEGAAVLYGSIAASIEKNSFEDGRAYKALIVDCGGGTTDISSCRYRIENRNEGYHVEMETIHENGDVNFGGNSLTLRIFQFLKILLSEKIGAVSNEIAFAGDPYRFVDEYGSDAYYAEFERRYDAAEAVIPTKFREWEKQSRGNYLHVKTNFYDLFRFAETLKERFFGTDETLALTLVSKEEHERELRLGVKKDSLAAFFPVPHWAISVPDRDGNLKKKKAWPNFTITVKEVEKLLAADIYALMRKFLERPFSENELGSFDSIKLTGQSCKIGLFKDVLKEFVPGLLLSYGSVGGIGDPRALKLACLSGALKYLHARRSGTVKVEIKKRQPFLPYILSADTHEGREKVLVNCLDETRLSGHVSRHLLELALPVHLKDSDGKSKHDFVYHSDPLDFKPAVYEDISALYAFIPQDETDCIVIGEVKFFVSAKPDDWAFVLVPVARGEEGLLLGKEEIFAFEDSEWEVDYFDGLK
jgi:hypothetical protein